MKAYVNGLIKDNLECSDGIVITFYKMIDGKKSIGTIDELLVTNDVQRSISTLQKELNHTSNNSDYSLGDLKKDLDVIKDILFYSYELLNDVKFAEKDFHGGGVPEEYVFMGRMRYTHWAMCIIELSKLFIRSKSHQYNLFTLLNKIESLSRKPDFPQIESFNIVDYKNSLNSGVSEKILSDLATIRNKWIAHTDKVIYDNTEELQADSSTLGSLQQTAFTIISGLSDKIFNTTISPYSPDSAVESVVKILNKEIKGEE
jgi:hypothetical protein